MNDKLPYARKYQDLLAYQLALDLSRKIYEETKSFPKEEIYSLTDQVRRSSRSVGAQIAEAWGKRLYVRHFISKLTDASAELFETEHWLHIANECGYLSEEVIQELKQSCFNINKLIGGMINKADLFVNRKNSSQY